MSIIESNILIIAERAINGLETVEEQLHAKEEMRTLLYLMRNERTFFKVCACGRGYNVAHWLGLPLVGYNTYIWCGEIRNCVCGSSLMVVTRKKPPQRVIAKSLSNSVVDTEVKKDGFKTIFTMDECARMIPAYKNTHVDVEYWNDDQLWDAARHGKTPEWKQENGVYIAA